MTAVEAKAKMEGWRDVLKAKLEGVAKGPWSVQINALACWYIAPGEGKGGAVVDSALPTGMSAGNPNLPFIAFSRSAVPAQLALIEAILKLYDEEPLPDGTIDSDELADGVRAGQEQALIVAAEAMEPFMAQVAE